MPGPPPSRDAERRRTNEKSTGPTVSVDIDELEGADVEGSLPFLIKQPIVIPSTPMADVDADSDEYNASVAWHPMALELWESMQRSGQALFWEPTDWMMAKLMCESISRDLKPQYVGVTAGTMDQPGEPIYERIPLKGASLGAYLKLCSQLMLTEGERRRLSIELERSRLAPVKSGPDAEVVNITDYRTAQLVVAQRKETRHGS